MLEEIDQLKNRDAEYRRSVVARFLDRILFSDKCWKWVGGTTAGRVGIISVGAHGSVSARSMAWVMFKGEPFCRGVPIVTTCGETLCVSPKHLARRRDTYESRFWAIVEKTNHCWRWNGLKSTDGYGSFFMGRLMNAHRASWIINVGKIPAGMSVLHKCDVRECVNPQHLFLGDQLDNMRDCSEKKRFNDRRGGLNPRAKLTAETVATIRRLHSNGSSGGLLAEMFGVGKTTVYHAINGDTWR
jgi:hypothetical protein